MKPIHTDTPAFGWADWNYWTAIGETAKASGKVIAKRKAIIDHAVRNPLDSDTQELTRMLTEKVLAFARSGQSLFDDAFAIQSLVLAQAQDMVALGLRGKWISPADYGRLSARIINIMNIIAHAGAGALQPVHATVTANARRLK